MVALRTYAEFELRHHYASWSMIKFMATVHPAAFGCLNQRLHGRKTSDGYPDSSDIPGVHRTAISECFGMSYPQFDDAWRAWALLQE
jgi:hypothetical protein